MSVECREMVDSLKKEPTICQECVDLEKEFAKNPGGKPIRNKGWYEMVWFYMLYSNKHTEANKQD